MGELESALDALDALAAEDLDGLVAPQLLNRTAFLTRHYGTPVDSRWSLDPDVWPSTDLAGGNLRCGPRPGRVQPAAWDAAWRDRRPLPPNADGSTRWKRRRCRRVGRRTGTRIVLDMRLTCDWSTHDNHPR